MADKTYYYDKSTTQAVANPWWIPLVEGILAIVVGLLLITAPAATTQFLVRILGLYWLLRGFFEIILMFFDSTKWGLKLLAGMLGVVLGIAVLEHPAASTILVPTTTIIIVGVGGIILGIINLVQAFQGKGFAAGLLGALSILFGLILLLHPFLGAISLPFVLGIFGLIGGVAAIIQAFRMR